MKFMRGVGGARIACAAITLALAACGRRGTDDVVTTGSALTFTQNAQVLGFENASQWSTSSGSKAQTTTRTQGSFALALNSPVNYSPTLTSTPLSSGPELSGITVGASFLVDLQVPTIQPNQYWFGAVQMFISCPSRNVYNQYMGQVELTGTPLGTFKTWEFKLSDYVAQSLQGATYSDLTLTVVLNLPSSGTATYILDNLRLKVPGASPINVRPLLTCVASRGNGVYDALFGYANEGTARTVIPVGADNKFQPGTTGRGQPERFFPGNTPAAFAVRFNGTAIDWVTRGGGVTASSQSPTCPTTVCAPACRRGEQCVGGKCVATCGDGLCAGDEGCTTCPADCGCGAGKVCLRNACIHPAKCGVEWQCGSGTSFGVALNCGSCPSGRTCVNHFCQ